MTSDRRQFLQKVGALSFGGLLNPTLTQALSKSIQRVQYQSLEATTQDETFWQQIKMAYTVSPQLLNLNNGGVSPQPLVVQKAQERYNKISNEGPTFYMWRILNRNKEALRDKLAGLAGCDPNEIAINRNTSEALETIIFGLPLKAGDEIVLSRNDYPNMINAWKQRAQRDGVVLKWLDLALPCEDVNTIVQAFQAAFSDKTRILHLTHLYNWCGQLLPAKEIIAAAHAQGIEVILDAAHTFAQIQYKIPDLDCDYFGTSLHKWLCAPFGTGMLYVKKEKIAKIYPLFAAPEGQENDIRKFENLGTRNLAIEQAIYQAIEFHEMIGGERKQARLHYLKNYWMKAVQDIPQVALHTSFSPDFSGAIGLFSIKDKDPSDIVQVLNSKFNIHTVAIHWENIHGVRISPNVYTLTKDLDRLIKAIRTIVKR